MSVDRSFWYQRGGVPHWESTARLVMPGRPAPRPALRQGRVAHLNRHAVADNQRWTLLRHQDLEVARQTRKQILRQEHRPPVGDDRGSKNVLTGVGVAANNQPTPRRREFRRQHFQA